MGVDRCSFQGVICVVFSVKIMYAPFLVWFGRLALTDGLFARTSHINGKGSILRRKNLRSGI